MATANNRLSPSDYEKNFSDLHTPYDHAEGAVIEANRCINCYDAPCTKSCPTGIDVPMFIKQIASGNIRGSAKTILSSNIMGGGCSRVCPVEKLCEGACVFNLLEEEPIHIAKLQRYATEDAIAQKWPIFSRKPSVGKKVAVVGAGPAGLACAHALAMEGVDVTVYEKEEKGGGLMTYGVAAYKVTPDFCRDEVDFITSIGGISIHYNTVLGKDIQLAELQNSFDAVFLGIGVGIARSLDIPGEDAEGVIDALSFIYRLRTSEFSSVAVGDKVAVIGMGMTAIDAATQSRRLGAGEVTLIYRRSENEKPCTDVELDLALLDGCRVIWLASPKEVVHENGKVKQLICAKMSLGDPDASGRRSPVDTGETFAIDADMIIKAAGQMPFTGLLSDSNIKNQNGKVSLYVDGSTNLKGVFAGGDCVNGGREVVNAVQEGKDGAKAILHYLQIV
jgi:dihydropyrimidine dehydrogenase (NAD+) subunit PreT